MCAVTHGTRVAAQPNKVFLFSGHMIDAPGRAEPRFPPVMEGAAARAIAQKLDELGATGDNLALCSGACGGDLLFAEACLERGVRLDLRLPFEVRRFIDESVAFAGPSWRERFMRVCRHPNTTLRVMTEALGPTPSDANAFERNNLWLLSSALSLGSREVHLICLWDGRNGDGPGGTRHMHDAVKESSGAAHVIDTNLLSTR